MPAEINYKKKYLELRSKYIGDLDMAFRLGVENGAQQAQQQQALDAQAQVREEKMQLQQAQAAGAPGQMGSEGENGPPSTEQPGQESAPAESGVSAPAGANASGPEAAPQQSTELDTHISQLESMLGSNPSPEIKKSLEAIVSLRKAEKQAIEMKKSEKAISGIVNALHKPQFKLGVQASHNMTDNGKKALSLQHKIVNDVMKSFAEEEAKAEKDIKNILQIENLIGE